MAYNHSYKDARRKRLIKFREIEVNACEKTLKNIYESKKISKKELANIYRDIAEIRFFEEMLREIKDKKSYNGREFFFEGPCHLAIGQEATAVAEAFYLDENDFIFGSHRSHHEVLAKGFSAIRKMSDDALEKIMNAEENSHIRDVIEKNYASKDIKTTARRFFIFGILCDIFAKKTGFCGGLAGSMHILFPPFGIYPSNAIVGASASIAAGAALYKKTQKNKGVVIANIGDGAAGRGPVFEAMNFSSMRQFDTLWEKPYDGGLPILFNFSNNYYGMNADTENETMSFSGDVARVGAFSENGMNAEKIDGWNIPALLDAYERKLSDLKNGKGPCLIEAITYRLCGHSVGDNEKYRDSSEVEEWKKHDPFLTFPSELSSNGILSEEDIKKITEDVKNEIDKIFLLASDTAIAPYIDFASEPDYIKDKVFNKKDFSPKSEKKPETLCAKDDIPRLKEIKKKNNYEIRDGIFEALVDGFYEDPSLTACGEDIRDWNTSTSVYGGFEDILPRHRFFNAPISEAAMVGMGVGYALCGGKILIEMMYSDFIGCAGDEIINQAAKWQSLSFGRLSVPIILHIPVGYDYGAQHSQELSSITASVPGLKVVYPVTPYDAKGLMTRALKENNPVIFFESKRLRGKEEIFKEKKSLSENYTLEIGRPRIVRNGDDITILSIGAPLYRTLEAAEILNNDYGISSEIIDAISLVPFNYEIIAESIKKTGKILLVSDAAERGSFAKEIAQKITELFFEKLKQPPVVLGAKNHIVPSYEYDNYCFPQAESIIQTINDFLIPLGLKNKRNKNNIIEDAKKGL